MNFKKMHNLYGDRFLCREIRIGERRYSNVLLTPEYTEDKQLRFIMSKFTTETANTIYINQPIELQPEYVTTEDLLC